MHLFDPKLMAKVRRAYRKAGLDPTEEQASAFLDELLLLNVPVIHRSSSRIAKALRGEVTVASLLTAASAIPTSRREKFMKDRYDIERVSCEERYGESKMTGPIIRFRVLKNGLPLPGLFDFFDEAQASAERAKEAEEKRRPVLIAPSVPSATNPPVWTATIEPPTPGKT
jgi:hypothetical protein